MCFTYTVSVYERHYFFYKQKTAYEMRISDWSSDVCSSDLAAILNAIANTRNVKSGRRSIPQRKSVIAPSPGIDIADDQSGLMQFKPVRASSERNSTGPVDSITIETTGNHAGSDNGDLVPGDIHADPTSRSDEHTSELQSLMRTSYAVFCL